MAALRGDLEKMGVTFHDATTVNCWRTEGRRVVAVETSRGAMEAEEFALCGGAWSPGIAHGLRVRLPMQAGKGYSLTLAKPRELPQLCAIFTEARVAVTPMDGALRFGGTMEIAGLDETINARRVAGIVKAVSRYYPQFSPDDFADVKPWVGLRPCSPDGMPFIGRIRAYDNLSTATGHAMMGLSLAPITGNLMADVLTRELPAHDLSLLDPNRYA